MRQESSTFTVWFNNEEKNGLQLATATLKPNDNVPSGSTLNFGVTVASMDSKYWHFLQYASLAYAWETTELWQNFTTFSLTNLHMAQHSLGGVPPPKGKPADWINYQISGLFAHTNFKATIVNMDGLQFDPDNSTEFYQSLKFALNNNTTKGNRTIAAVSLVGTSPSLASFETELRNQFPHITFTFS